ncbi:perlucin-like [Ruditapes philippinarum]|uniref:perlucin-like n=1 Tax=Ruditapes philippinarum TaxID=129788 RepID=UPI00295AA40F|nr:perlucin-like [Ruditapes philippinarum]
MKVHCLILVLASILDDHGIIEGYKCCQNGWVVYEDSCYLFADHTNVDWTEATHFCDAHDHSHIVTIESRSEELFLRDHCQRLFKTGASRDNWFWIGATDDEIEGIWVWYTNHKPITDVYTNWAPGQPDPADWNQDCAVLWGPNGYVWEDHICDLKSHVICERNITASREQEIFG